MTLTTLREARPEDAEAIAAIHIGSWQAAYRHLLPAAYLDSLSAQLSRRTSQWRQRTATTGHGVLVAQDGPEVVGWIASERLSRDEGASSSTGEIQAIYLAPEHWRRGLGRRLIAAALQDLARQGCGEATLWVLQGNEQAVAFYRTLGFDAEPAATQVIERGGVRLVEQRYRRELG